MKIIHHNDNDGYCSAAIVKAFLTGRIVDGMLLDATENDFFAYSYNLEFNKPTVVEHETVYIVDVSLDDRIFDFIQYCVSVGANVIHIDHHKSGLDWLDAHPDSADVMNKITAFYEIGVSASLMTYAYSCMNETELENPNVVKWDDGEQGNLLNLNGRTYSIPLCIQYVNDYDVSKWRFGKDTSHFQLGLFMTPYNNKPYEKEWLDLLTNDSIVTNMMMDGEAAYRYRSKMHNIALNKGFVSVVDNKAWLVVNSDFADSQLYGEYIDQFDVCCCVQYYGDKWVYHICSGEHSNADVNEIAQAYAGGGHVHAAGFSDDGTVLKMLLDNKLKTMREFIDAYEQAKRDMKAEAAREAEEKERLRQQKLRENFLKGIN
jgi:nanoRNase/pAp phosphatase (c-di-AMP/oligoRNAs hydrolase)